MLLRRADAAPARFSLPIDPAESLDPLRRIASLFALGSCAGETAVPSDILDKNGGPLDQQTVCGCIDYRQILPQVCNSSVILTIATTNAGGTGELAVSSTTTLKYTSGTDDGSEEYVAAAPYASFACLVSGAKVGSFQNDENSFLWKDTKKGVDTEQGCAIACHEVIDSACAAYHFTSPSTCTLYNALDSAHTTGETPPTAQAGSQLCERLPRAAASIYQPHTARCVFDVVPNMCRCAFVCVRRARVCVCVCVRACVCVCV